MHDLRRPKPKVSPREFRKSSQIRRAAASPVKVAGQRVPTETGYRVPGYYGKSFETSFEVMLPGSASGFYLHEKKDKSIWIVGGQGFVTTGKVGEPPKTRRVIIGDTVSFDRGTTYRISTTASEQLEFFVTQAARYDVTLQTIMPSDATKVATDADLVEPTLDERLGTAGLKPRERKSKAAQQQARLHRKSAQIEETFRVVPESTVMTEPARAGYSAGVNAKPSGGRFSDAGAG